MTSSRRLRWLVCLAAVLGFAACDRFAVSDRIGAQARSTGSVDLATAADFPWTQVRIYTPYSTRQAVCNDLGALAPDCLQTAPDGVPEGEYLLVFLDGGKVVRYVRHHRRNGHFQSSSGVLTVGRHAATMVAQCRITPDTTFCYLRQKAGSPVK